LIPVRQAAEAQSIRDIPRGHQTDFLAVLVMLSHFFPSAAL
jgi:hypothetical protein